MVRGNEVDGICLCVFSIKRVEVGKNRGGGRDSRDLRRGEDE